MSSTQSAETQSHACDLCGSNDAAEIEVARLYTGGRPLHVCRDCGFVYVRERRSAQAIADAWSDDIYGSGYTARIPAVKARQVYVAEMIDVEIGLAGKKICDIGAGEGQFLEMIRGGEYGAKVFGIEPSKANCRLMDETGIANFAGTIETYLDRVHAYRGSFDIVTIMWTLENCQSCGNMLDAARQLLAPGGHIIIATGSRILVPFKKPLSHFLADEVLDTHAFRFSANTLQRAILVSGFEPVTINRYIDTDYLVLFGQKGPDNPIGKLPVDDWRKVIEFFDAWHEDTERFYRNK